MNSRTVAQLDSLTTWNGQNVIPFLAKLRPRMRVQYTIEDGDEAFLIGSRFQRPCTGQGIPIPSRISLDICCKVEHDFELTSAKSGSLAGAANWGSGEPCHRGEV